MDPEKLQRAFRNLKAQSLHSVNSINSYDFSTVYTAFPHDKLKSKLEQVDGELSHMPAPSPSHISVHIKIPTAFLQSSSIGLSPVKVLRF